MENQIKILKKHFIVSNLQKKILHQGLHDVQSPISAVSGYLELMQLTIDSDNDPFKMARYKKQIQTGIGEIEQILKQIRYSHEDTPADFEPLSDKTTDTEVDIFWFIDDICSNIEAYAKKRDQEIILKRNTENIYIKTDLFLLKLVMLNLFIQVLKITPKSQSIVINSKKSDSNLDINIETNSCVKPTDEILRIFSEETDKSSSFEVNNLLQPISFGVSAVLLLNSNIKVQDTESGGIQIVLRLPLGN